MKNKRGISNAVTVTFLLLGLLIALLQLYVTSTGTNWGEMLSIGEEPEVDCASLEEGQEQCCIAHHYGHWDNFEKMCIADISASSDSGGGGGR